MGVNISRFVAGRVSSLRTAGRKILAGAVSVTLLYSTAAVPFVEAGLWESRRAAVSKANDDGRAAKDSRLARLPAQHRGSTLADGIVPGLTHAGHAAHPVFSSPREQHLRTGRPLPPVLKNLPFAYGEIQKIHVAPAPAAGLPFIFLIQDAHEIESAQRNIAGALEFLQANAAAGQTGRLIVGMEGATGAYETAKFRALKHDDVRRDISDLLLRQTFINGAEFYGLTARTEPELWGVEDETLYLRNVAAYRQGQETAAGTKETLDALDAALTLLKRQAFDARALALDDALAQYQRRTLDLNAFLRALVSFGSFSPAAYPQTQKFLNVLQTEQSLDFKAVEAQRNRLIKTLAENLDKPQLDRLLEESMSYRLGRVGYGTYYSYLKNLLEAAGVSLSQFPDFDRYVHYVLLSEHVKPEDLLNEMERLQKATVDAVARTETQKRLFRCAADLDLIGRLTRQELTPAEWSLYQERRAEIVRLPARIGSLQGAAGTEGTLSALLTAHEGFYAAADARNQALVRNLVAKTQEAKGLPLAAMIAGGFHTPGLEQEFARHNLSYAVFRPKIGKIDRGNADYLHVFSANRTPLEKALLGDRLFMSAPGALAARTYPGVEHVKAVMVNLWKYVYPAAALRRHQAALTVVELQALDASTVDVEKETGSAVLYEINGRPTAIGESPEAVRAVLRDPGAPTMDLRPGEIVAIGSDRPRGVLHAGLARGARAVMTVISPPEDTSTEEETRLEDIPAASWIRPDTERGRRYAYFAAWWFERAFAIGVGALASALIIAAGAAVLPAFAQPLVFAVATAVSLVSGYIFLRPHKRWHIEAYKSPLVRGVAVGTSVTSLLIGVLGLAHPATIAFIVALTVGQFLLDVPPARAGLLKLVPSPARPAVRADLEQRAARSAQRAGAIPRRRAAAIGTAALAVAVSAPGAVSAQAASVDDLLNALILPDDRRHFNNLYGTHLPATGSTISIEDRNIMQFVVSDRSFVSLSTYLTGFRRAGRLWDARLAGNKAQFDYFYGINILTEMINGVPVEHPQRGEQPVNSLQKIFDTAGDPRFGDDAVFNTFLTQEMPDAIALYSALAADPGFLQLFRTLIKSGITATREAGTSAGTIFQAAGEYKQYIARYGIPFNPAAFVPSFQQALTDANRLYGALASNNTQRTAFNSLFGVDVQPNQNLDLTVTAGVTSEFQIFLRTLTMPRGFLTNPGFLLAVQKSPIVKTGALTSPDSVNAFNRLFKPVLTFGAPLDDNGFAAILTAVEELDTVALSRFSSGMLVTAEKTILSNAVLTDNFNRIYGTSLVANITGRPSLDALRLRDLNTLLRVVTDPPIINTLINSLNGRAAAYIQTQSLRDSFNTVFRTRLVPVTAPDPNSDAFEARQKDLRLLFAAVGANNFNATNFNLAITRGAAIINNPTLRASFDRVYGTRLGEQRNGDLIHDGLIGMDIGILLAVTGDPNMDFNGFSFWFPQVARFYEILQNPGNPRTDAFNGLPIFNPADPQSDLPTQGPAVVVSIDPVNGRIVLRDRGIKKMFDYVASPDFTFGSLVELVGGDMNAPSSPGIPQPTPTWVTKDIDPAMEIQITGRGASRFSHISISRRGDVITVVGHFRAVQHGRSVWRLDLRAQSIAVNDVVVTRDSNRHLYLQRVGLPAGTPTSGGKYWSGLLELIDMADEQGANLSPESRRTITDLQTEIIARVTGASASGSVAANSAAAPRPALTRAPAPARQNLLPRYNVPGGWEIHYNKEIFRQMQEVPGTPGTRRPTSGRVSTLRDIRPYLPAIAAVFLAVPLALFAIPVLGAGADLPMFGFVIQILRQIGMNAPGLLAVTLAAIAAIYGPGLIRKGVAAFRTAPLTRNEMAELLAAVLPAPARASFDPTDFSRERFRANLTFLLMHLNGMDAGQDADPAFVQKATAKLRAVNLKFLSDAAIQKEFALSNRQIVQLLEELSDYDPARDARTRLMSIEGRIMIARGLQQRDQRFAALMPALTLLADHHMEALHEAKTGRALTEDERAALKKVNDAAAAAGPADTTVRGKWQLIGAQKKLSLDYLNRVGLEKMAGDQRGLIVTDRETQEALTRDINNLLTVAQEAGSPTDYAGVRTLMENIASGRIIVVQKENLQNWATLTSVLAEHNIVPPALANADTEAPLMTDDAVSVKNLLRALEPGLTLEQIKQEPVQVSDYNPFEWDYTDMAEVTLLWWAIGGQAIKLYGGEGIQGIMKEMIHATYA